MTLRSVMIYGVLFILALGGAYASWTYEPDDAKDDGVVLLQAKPDELASVRFESKDVDATIEVKNDELGSYAWVSTQRRIDKRKPANPHVPAGANAPADAPADEAAHTQETSFKAGTTGDQLLEDLAPLRVVRALDVSQDRLAEFGLTEPESKLTVTTKSGTELTLDIGSSGYGHQNVYLRDAKTKRVYVAKKTMINPLERADTRLPEKRLFDFERGDVESVALSTGETSLQFVQRNREDASAARWTAPGSDEPAESAQNWLDKVFRLRSTGYVPDAETPEALEPAFSVKLTPADGKPVAVHVLRGAGEDGQPAYFARSDFTRGLVTLSAPIANDVVEDLATVLPVDP